MSDTNQNTMIELTRTNKITIGVVAVLIVLLLGFLFVKPTEYTFKTKLDKELVDIKKAEFQVSPQEVSKAILNKDQNTILVDVRSQFEFAKGHLPEAKNISKVNLFEKGNIDFFRELAKSGKKAVLYGDSSDDANVPFMILKQMGIENIGYLSVGYDILKSGDWKTLAVDSKKYNDEIPVADFAKFIEEAKSSKQAISKASVKEVVNTSAPVPKPKVVAPATPSKGGDEGC